MDTTQQTPEFNPDELVTLTNKKTKQVKRVKRAELPDYGLPTNYQSQSDIYAKGITEGRVADESKVPDEYRGGTIAALNDAGFKKEDVEAKKTAAQTLESAKGVKSVLEKGKTGELQGEAYDDALNYASAEFNKKAFGEGGKQLTGSERAILAGTMIGIQEYNGNILDWIKEKTTGYGPPKKSKISDPEETIERKVNQAISGLEKGTVPITAADPQYKDSMSLPDGQMPNIPSETKPKEPKKDNAFRHGILKTASDQLPLLGAVVGGVAGAGIGGLAGVPTGPGLLATAAAGGAIVGGMGAAAGEGARQMLQDDPDGMKALEEGGLGAIGGAAGPVVGAVAKPVFNLATKMPVIGPVVEAAGSIGDDALKKIFGAGGEQSAAEGGAKVLETVKRWGMNVKGNADDLMAAAKGAQAKMGEKYAEIFGKAAEQGKFGKNKDVAQFIQDSLPGNDPVEIKAKTKFRNEATKLILRDSGIENADQAGSEAILKGLQGDPDFRIAPQTLNNIKQRFQDMAFSEYPDKSPEQVAAKKIAANMRKYVEETVGDIDDIKTLNADYQNSRDIVAHLQKLREGATNMGQKESIHTSLNPMNQINTVAGQQTINQLDSTAKFSLKNVLPQILTRKEQEEANKAVGLKTTY